MPIFNMVGGGGGGEVKTATYTLSSSDSSTIVFSGVSKKPTAYWVVLTDKGSYDTRNNGVTSVVCGSSSGNPIFTYINNGYFQTNTGSSSNVYISSNELTFSTSGVEYYLYFVLGTWTLYYIE